MKLCLVIPLAMLTGCVSTEAPKPAAAPVKRAAPVDESRKMPLENRVSVGVVDDHALGKSWLPGGTVGHYKKGTQEWDLILVKANSSATAAGWLLDYKKELEGAKLVPSFGGFYGADKGRLVFFFAKGPSLAVVAGLSEPDADAIARVFASRLSY